LLVTETDRPTLLEVKGISKSFAGNTVLADVDLSVRAGEVHAIMGENGAGKSTLIKTLGGVYHPERGELLIAGEPVRLRSPRDAVAAGIIVIHQELSLARHLSAEENIFFGHFPKTGFGTIDRKFMRRRARELLARLFVDIDPGRPVGELSIAQQQMVEIAKALSHNARVLILDEPTAVLDSDRTETLFEVIGKLKAEGLGIVYISHHLEEIFRIADRVTVLRDGRKTGEARVADIDQDWLVNRMVGREFSYSHARAARPVGKPALEIEDLALEGVFDNISLSVREGEIVGLAGLVGAGRSEVARAVIGLTPPSSGTIKIFGRKVAIRHPGAAARLGIAYLTEDRKAEGLLPNRPVSENATISNLKRFTNGLFLSRSREKAFVAETIRQLDVRLSEPGIEIRKLSGGNQQKVLLGRALAVRPKILILDEPTRGVDIGAKQEIYKFIEQLVAEGLAILLISSEMEEVLHLSDHVVVLRQGRVAARLKREEATETSIMRAAALAQ
jgi:ABC-type sugar transport system ATPase subunit